MLLRDKIALITGASRGIGRAVAKKYIDEGAHVIAVARTVGALEELDDYARERGSHITIVPLDVTDFIKIDELGYQLFHKFGYLDIFVGNAGVLGGCCPIGHYKPESWQRVIDVNLTANWRFIRSFDPLLRKAAAGRVIFVTSSVVRNDPAYYGAYTTSKAGLEALAKVYANETLKTNIKINLISPGSVKTRLHAEAFPDHSSNVLKNPEDVVDIFVKLARSEFEESGKLFTPQKEVVY